MYHHRSGINIPASWHSNGMALNKHRHFINISINSEISALKIISSGINVAKSIIVKSKIIKQRVNAGGVTYSAL